MELPVYLIGYMGAGKSTVGRLLADKLGWHFVDLDAAFAEINGMTTAEYIRRHGIEAFRKLEKACVEKLAELPIQKVIYATGGGYPCWEDNMDCLKELGTSVYLRWSNEHLARRITLSGTEQRPVLQNRQGRELLDFVAWQMSGREPYYAQADYIVDAPLQGGLAEENDEQIADHLYHYILSRL
ncbi:MAG: shikimate kinase [Paludibacteraceae bacterium]|nr:shikimate kinase [Paludibacteraceae bacterium]MBQ9705535.1 shikimate kinase [Paludibacteraceae bacterium]